MTKEEMIDVVIDSGMNKQYNKDIVNIATKLARKVITLREDNVTTERIKELHSLANDMFPKVTEITKIDLNVS